MSAVVDRAGDGTCFRVLRRAAPPRVRLLCLPHAGGAAGAFRPWARRLHPDVELVAVQYPGRQDRLGEPYAQSVAELVDPVCDVLAARRDGLPLVLFGHSMGAAVAYEVAVALAVAGQEAPALLAVSGRDADAAPPTVDLTDDEALLDDVVALNTELAELRDQPELAEVVLPTVRADYGVLSDYRPSARRISAPVVTYSGRDDPRTTEAGQLAWGRRTTDALARVVLPGDHFYRPTGTSALVADLVERCA